jgi:hypothetical protein
MILSADFSAAKRLKIQERYQVMTCDVYDVDFLVLHF